jgi:hypothetical protein
MTRNIAVLLAAALLISGCWQGYTYRAEVGYYEGGEQRWYVGPDQSRDECQSSAINRFNALNRESPGRAFSWACRKMQGERFLERVR